jgi:hypothetical protein
MFSILKKLLPYVLTYLLGGFDNTTHVLPSGDDTTMYVDHAPGQQQENIALEKFDKIAKSINWNEEGRKLNSSSQPSSFMICHSNLWIFVLPFLCKIFSTILTKAGAELTKQKSVCKLGKLVICCIHT